MDEFSGLGEIEKLSKSNHLIEPTQVERQNDTNVEENRMIELCRNDIDSLINNVISDISLEGKNSSLSFEHGIKNQGEAFNANGRCEQARLNENVISKDVNLKLGESINKPEQISMSSKIERGLGNQEEQVENMQSDLSKSRKSEGYEYGVNDTPDNRVEEFTPPPITQYENLRVVVLAVGVDSCEKSRQTRKPKATSSKTESPKQLSVSSARVLRSRSKENREDREPSVDLETRNGSIERRVKKKGKAKDVKSNDEFARMRTHLKYLLQKISYEQSYLDAYSSEGWRGQSLEKLRPEKELERAKANIYRFKLKIRDLFQRIESISSQGKFPESLYDSDGLIDSEDIFCSKCGTNDSSPGNDILLCDGVCDRGFHQNCLNPPLPTEEIPPGDEGWLCPACDCKVDCYNLLNDSHGTKLTIEDSWEKVFPEAISTSVNNLDDIMGLPSDDSEDNEYNPDGGDDESYSERNESSSNESGSDDSDSSDFSSASEDLGPICRAQQNLGLSSNDSEDDDFDPDAPNVDENGVEVGSSGSDFSSDSEDLGLEIGDEGTLDQGERCVPLLEQDLDESLTIMGKRCAKRLDYKKLYDETFGNVASDSSGDEEWTDIIPTRKRKIKTEITNCPSTSNSGSRDPRKKGQPKVNSEIANGSTPQSQKNSRKTKSAGSSERKPPLNKLGEAVTKRLYESFKENQCPDSETKEKLANEVGLTLHRVHKWFANARWNLNHHPSQMEARMNRIISSTTTPMISVESVKSVNVKSGGSSERRRPPCNKLGEEVIKRLHESFKENQYPDRETKEKLANEVGLTIRRVDKWFENARWSLRHHPSRMEARMNRVTSSSDSPQSVACNGVETTITIGDVAKSDLPECEPEIVLALPKCGNSKEFTPMRPREIQGNESENPQEGTSGNPLQGSEIAQGRILRKRRKSCP